MVHAPGEHKIDSDMFSDPCMDKITNGKIKNLGCLARLFLEQTSSRKTPLPFTAEKNVRRRCSIGRGGGLCDDAA